MYTALTLCRRARRWARRQYSGVGYDDDMAYYMYRVACLCPQWAHVAYHLSRAYQARGT